MDLLIHFQSFDDDYADFETKIQDLDRRLATIFCQAFDDCTSIESCAKVGVGGDLWAVSRGGAQGMPQAPWGDLVMCRGLQMGSRPRGAGASLRPRTPRAAPVAFGGRLVE